LGEGITNPGLKKTGMLRKVTGEFELDAFFGVNERNARSIIFFYQKHKNI
jgi:hypothetical protein